MNRHVALPLTAFQEITILIGSLILALGVGYYSDNGILMIVILLGTGAFLTLVQCYSPNRS